MIEFIRDVIKAIYSFAKSKLKKSYSLIKDEGFSSGFARLLIVLISIGASAFGTVGLLTLIFYLGNTGYFRLEPLFKISADSIRILDSILFANSLEELMLQSFIVLHLPPLAVIIIQKIITKNLIKKYRDNESNLIKP